MGTQLNPGLIAANAAVSVDEGCVHENIASGFGVAAACAIVFNTALAWTKDAYEPLNAFMASLTGHHWRTHGLVDVLLFFAIGALLAFRTRKQITNRLTIAVVAASVVAGAGLAAWFFFV